MCFLNINLLEINSEYIQEKNFSVRRELKTLWMCSGQRIICYKTGKSLITLQNSEETMVNMNGIKVPTT